MVRACPNFSKHFGMGLICFGRISVRPLFVSFGVIGLFPFLWGMSVVLWLTAFLGAEMQFLLFIVCQGFVQINN